jgi:hypothetical protein
MTVLSNLFSEILGTAIRLASIGTNFTTQWLGISHQLALFTSQAHFLISTRNQMLTELYLTATL